MGTAGQESKAQCGAVRLRAEGAYECDMDADPFYSQNPNAMSVNTATRDYGAELDEIRKAIDEIYKELALADCYYEQKIKEETERLSQWIEGPRYP